MGYHLALLLNCYPIPARFRAALPVNSPGQHPKELQLRQGLFHSVRSEPLPGLDLRLLALRRQVKFHRYPEDSC